MSDWRTERDVALLALEREAKAQSRAESATALVELAIDHPDRWSELASVLPRMLADKQPEVRRSGLALGALVLPLDEAERLLSSRLSDPVPEVRMEAAGQLADLALPSTRGALAAALEDSSFAVRFEAARGIAALHHSAGLDVLMEALDKDALRFRALGAIAALGDARALPAVKKLFKRWLLPPFERTQAAGALAKLGDPDGAAYLMERTKKKGSMDRPFAIEACGDVKAPGARERLLAILADRGDACRGAAARGLGRLGGSDVLAPLAKVLEDITEPEEVRLDAAQGLALLGVPEVKSVIEKAKRTFAAREAQDELEALLADGGER